MPPTREQLDQLARSQAFVEWKSAIKEQRRSQRAIDAMEETLGDLQSLSSMYRHLEVDVHQVEVAFRILSRTDAFITCYGPTQAPPYGWGGTWTKDDSIIIGNISELSRNPITSKLLDQRRDLGVKIYDKHELLALHATKCRILSYELSTLKTELHPITLSLVQYASLQAPVYSHINHKHGQDGLAAEAHRLGFGNPGIEE